MGPGLIKVYSNDDPGLALAYLCQDQIWSFMLLYGEKVKFLITGRIEA